MSENDDRQFNLDYLGKVEQVIELFPRNIQQKVVLELERLVYGIPPLSYKKLKGLGLNIDVFELVMNGKPAYRVIYAINSKTIYVIHAFSKNNNTLDKKDETTIIRRARSIICS